MKKFLYLVVSLFIFCGMSLSLCLAQGGTEQTTKEESERYLSGSSPVELLRTVTAKANLYPSDRVQNTKLNNVTSKVCTEAIGVTKRYSLTRTLCNIKGNILPYLQYVIRTGLTAATILIIRNGFQLVISEDRGKKMGEFKKHIVYIIVGVALIISFYWILDIFVSLINFIAE